MWTRLLILLSRVQAVLSGRRVDADLNQEIDAHLTMLTEENIRRGLTPDEAHRQARLRFGGVAQLDLCRDGGDPRRCSAVRVRRAGLAGHKAGSSDGFTGRIEPQSSRRSQRLEPQSSRRSQRLDRSLCSL